MAFRFLIVLSLIIFSGPVIEASDQDNEIIHTVKKRRKALPPSEAYMANLFSQVRPQDRYEKQSTSSRYMARLGPERSLKNAKGEPLDFLSPMPLILQKEIAYDLIINDPGAFLKLTRASKTFGALRVDLNIRHFTLDYLGDLTGNPAHFNAIYRGVMHRYPLHNLMHILSNKRRIQGFFAPDSPYWRMHLRIGNNLNLYLPGPPYSFLPESLCCVPFVPTHISEFNDLEALTVANDCLVALPPLTNLTALKSLILRENHVPEVCLDTLTQLTTLELYGQRCSSLSRLTNLESLSLTLKNNCDVPSIETLGGSLKTLHIFDPSRGDFPELSHLTGLRELRLPYNRFLSLPDLSSHQNLIDLDVGDIGLTALMGIDQLSNLMYLQGNNNKLSQIANLHRLTNLRQLRLQGNQLTTIQGIEALGKLRDLFLGHNRLKRLPRSWNTPSLSQIQVQGNQLNEISGLEGLPKLQDLYIAGNKPLVKLHGFEHLTRMERLLISCDQTPTKEYLLRQSRQNGSSIPGNLDYMIRIIDPNKNF